MSDARASLDQPVTLDLASFGAPSSEQLTGLVLELASQLHIERVRRIALEAQLEAAGVIQAEAPLTPAQRSLVRSRADAALGKSMSGLVRVMTEGTDQRKPLRPEPSSDPQTS